MSILFLGWGDADGVTHYRTILPAQTLGCDWGVVDMNGKVTLREGARDHHDVIVVQTAWHKWQLKLIQNMKQQGSFVLLNVDDWVKGIGRMKTSHGFASTFDSKKLLDIHYRIMRLADGVICSTDWLADRCRMMNPNVAVARNMLDLERYERVEEPVRDSGTVIGWAGGTGHREALRSVMEPLTDVLVENEDVHFAMLGDDMSGMFGKVLRDRVHHLPWSPLQLYPELMAAFDMVIAPAQENDFYRAKSQLRFYEACAMGLPTVGAPMYDEIVRHDTGFIAETSDDWYRHLTYLVKNPEVRVNMGKAARLYVQQNVGTGSKRANEWTAAINQLAADVPDLWAFKEPEAEGVHEMPEAAVGSPEQSGSYGPFP